MTAQTIDVEATLTAIETALLAPESLKEAMVEVNERVNDDASRMPWIGIYRTGATFPSRALGAGAGNRLERLGLALILQQTHVESGRKCGQLLEDLKRAVISTLLADETLGGNVDVLEDFEVTYSNYGLTDSGAFTQQAIIQFTGVTRVRGG